MIDSNNMMLTKPNPTHLARIELHDLVDKILDNKNNIKWIYNTNGKYIVNVI